MCMTTIQALIELCLLCVFTPVASGCNPGWFGNSCNYQCHCSNNQCDVSGECTAGSKCNSEWFGPACQYQDLFSIAVISTIPTIDQSTLKDRDDNTCLEGNIEDVTINLNSSYTITWLRVTVNSNDFKHNITMVLNDAQGSTFTCNNGYLIDERTMDLFCDAPISTAKLTLRGKDVGYLCSLSISGGRNVALKQRAVQSSNSNNLSLADKAVDGNRDTIIDIGNSCSHTNDGSPYWSVTLSNVQLVDRYVLFNRHDFQERLRKANLSSYNADNRLVFNYILPDADQIVFVVTDVPKNVSYVTIYAGYTSNMIVTLCEVEIYGDSVCPMNHFGLECDKSCNCQNKTETCFVATGGCPSGCAAGFYGDGCQKNCPQGRWGVDCVNQCSVHCKNKICERLQGKCYLGCEDGYKGDTCTSECPKLTWGSQCLKRCSDHCLNRTCDFVNGVCDHGCDRDYNNTQCLDGCNNGLASGIGIGIGVTIAADVIICIAVCIWLKRRKKPLPKPHDTTDRQNDHVDAIQSRNTTTRLYDHVEHIPSCDATDRHYDHVDPIQPNEHPYNTVDKSGDDYKNINMLKML